MSEKRICFCEPTFRTRSHQDWTGLSWWRGICHVTPCSAFRFLIFVSLSLRPESDLQPTHVTKPLHCSWRPAAWQLTPGRYGGEAFGSKRSCMLHVLVKSKQVLDRSTLIVPLCVNKQQVLSNITFKTELRIRSNTLNKQINQQLFWQAEILQI